MIVTATQARKDIFGLIEQVNDDHIPVHVTSRKGNAVLISEADFDAWVETAYLLRSPQAAARLLDSIEQAKLGNYTEHDLSAVAAQVQE